MIDLSKLKIQVTTLADLKDNGRILDSCNVINDSLYDNKEDSHYVERLFLSNPEAYIITLDYNNALSGISVASVHKNPDMIYFDITAFKKNIRNEHLYKMIIDMRLEYGNQHGALFAGGTTMDPFVMDVMSDEGFFLPTEPNEATSKLLESVKEILIKKHGNDLGITKRFVIPGENIPYPNLSETGIAYSINVRKFVNDYMNIENGDRFFFAKWLKNFY